MRQFMSFVAAVSLAATSACAMDLDEEITEDDLGVLEEDVIVGNDDLLLVNKSGSNVPSRYRPLLDGFGQVFTPKGPCTATHVGGGIVISAGHCFSAPAERANNKSCAGIKVKWGVRGNGVASESRCTKILAMQEVTDRDYAIFRVTPVPPVKVKVDFRPIPAVGTKLTLFSHAATRPLQWSRTCRLEFPNDVRFWYQCDTLGGSSGAAVLADGPLKVIGIHRGGEDGWNLATGLSATPLAEFVD